MLDKYSVIEFQKISMIFKINKVTLLKCVLGNLIKTRIFRFQKKYKMHQGLRLLIFVVSYRSR